jgi:hypothetical protein
MDAVLVLVEVNAPVRRSKSEYTYYWKWVVK